jgi:hypothetical protein
VCDRLRLTTQSFGQFGLGNFESNRAVEPQIAGSMDFIHAACANRRARRQSTNAAWRF